jgi:hypothetical protein
MNPFKIVIGFVPFILLSVLAAWMPFGWAAVVGAVAALVVTAMTARGGLKLLPVVQAVILLALAVVAFASGPAVTAVLEAYGRGIASVLLGLVIVATAVRWPFTAQFARAVAPPAVWHSPAFLALNRRLSLAWGGVVLLLGVCHLVGPALAAQHAPSVLRLLVDAVVPIAAFLAVIGYTRRAAAGAHTPTHA